MSQFFQTPASIMFYEKLTSDDKIVFSLIYGYLKKNQTCWYTNEELAIVINKSVKTVERIISKLVKLGLVDIIGHSYRRKFKLGNNFKQLEKNQNTTLTSDVVEQDLNTSLTHVGDNPHPCRGQPSPVRETSLTHVVENREQNKENNKEQQPIPSVASPEIPPPSKPETVVVVFSKTVDHQLLDFVFKLPSHLQPTFQSSNLELLSACKFHIEIQMKTEQISFDFAMNKLKKLMRNNQFQKPNGFESQEDLKKINQAKIESEKWLIDLAEESKRRGALELKTVTQEQVNEVRSLGLSSIFKSMNK